MKIRFFIKKAFIFFKPIILIFLSLFFEKKYLIGRHFDVRFSGYRWALSAIWGRYILRLATPMPFPTALNCHISNSENIHFHPDDLNNFQTSGTYFQNFLGEIFLGKGCYIAPNVGIITANHDLMSLDHHLPPQNVVIGENCWIGMNSVILPGVTLGSRTVVGAGSVVTKSFPDGYCMIAGTPARKIKDLSQNAAKPDEA